MWKKTNILRTWPYRWFWWPNFLYLHPTVVFIFLHLTTGIVVEGFCYHIHSSLDWGCHRSLKGLSHPRCEPFEFGFSLYRWRRLRLRTKLTLVSIVVLLLCYLTCYLVYLGEHMLGFFCFLFFWRKRVNRLNVEIRLNVSFV